jgi:hypothetical protein
MHKFFADKSTFRHDLRTKPVRDDACWSCSTTTECLFPVNLIKSLGVPDPSVQPRDPGIRRCGRCSVDYLNSHDTLLAEYRGENRPSVWTEKRLLDCVREVTGY